MNKTIVAVLALMAALAIMFGSGNFELPFSLYDDVHAYVYGSCDGLLPQVWEYRTKLVDGQPYYIESGIMDQYPDRPVNVIQTSTTIDVVFCDGPRESSHCKSIPISYIANNENSTFTVSIEQGPCTAPTQPPTQPPEQDILWIPLIALVSIILLGIGWKFYA